MSSAMNTQIFHLGKKFGVPTGKLRESLKTFTPKSQTKSQMKMIELELKTGERLKKFGLDIVVEWPKKENGFGLYDRNALGFEWESKNQDDDVAETNFNFQINWKVLVLLGLMGFVNKEAFFWVIKAIGIFFAVQIAAVAYIKFAGNKI